MVERTHQRQLSKFLSLILRHQPGRFGLELDADGFVGLADVLAAVRRERGWGGVTEAEVREVVASSDKQRFEIVGERIRARYGHSVPRAVAYPEVEPPAILYHGTSPGSLRPSAARASVRCGASMSTSRHRWSRRRPLGGATAGILWCSRCVRGRRGKQE
jgi:RNA:NAD 2'-phosphotransferase (TPT1/KptA family)